MINRVIPLTESTCASFMPTKPGGGGTVKEAEADFVKSDTEVAVSLTLRLLAGSATGGVYIVGVPLGVDVGETLPQGMEEQDTVQVTPLAAGSSVTVAVTCWVEPGWTLAAPGETETVRTGGGGGGLVEPPPQPELAIASTTAVRIPRSGVRFLDGITGLVRTRKFYSP
jgi:hypothetical protein